MIRVAITGNIASGKSVVQNILEKQGFKVLDTDKVGHEVLNCDEIKATFSGFDVFSDDGNISREKLGKLIFEHSELKRKLEDISHPKIADKILEFFAENKAERVLFVGIPLVFEAGMENLFDKIVLIYTDDEVRKLRLMTTRGYSEAYADVRMGCQLSQDKKSERADYVIFNNKSIKDLEIEVYKFLKSFYAN